MALVWVRTRGRKVVRERATENRRVIGVRCMTCHIKLTLGIRIACIQQFYAGKKSLKKLFPSTRTANPPSFNSGVKRNEEALFLGRKEEIELH